MLFRQIARSPSSLSFANAGSSNSESRATTPMTAVRSAREKARCSAWPARHKKKLKFIRLLDFDRRSITAFSATTRRKNVSPRFVDHEKFVVCAQWHAKH